MSQSEVCFSPGFAQPFLHLVGGLWLQAAAPSSVVPWVHSRRNSTARGSEGKK